MQRVTRTLLLSATSLNTESPAGGARVGGSGSAARDTSSADMHALGQAEIRAPCDRSYRPALATFELVAEVRRLLATERRTECLLCRYLGDLADRIQARQDAELGVYDDELDAARHLFGLGARDTRERVRVGRALRNLPEIERAFVDGELCYSRVREVTRVATVRTESNWLELARVLDMRSLERRVAAEREAAGRKSSRSVERRVGRSARTEWISPETVRVTFDLSREAWTLLEQAMREARRTGSAGPSDGDALEAIARAALSVPCADTCDAGDEGIPNDWQTWVDDEARAEEGAAEPGPSFAEPRGFVDENRGFGMVPHACARMFGKGPTMLETGLTILDTGPSMLETGPSMLDTRARGGSAAECEPEPGGASEPESGATMLETGTAMVDEGTAMVDTGATMLERAATQGGSLDPRRQNEVRCLGTRQDSASEVRDVSSGEPNHGGADNEWVGSGTPEGACEPTVRLMGVMRRGRGWTLDALAEASGLSAQQVCVAMTLLELGGRVRRHAFAFDPV